MHSTSSESPIGSQGNRPSPASVEIVPPPICSPIPNGLTVGKRRAPEAVGEDSQNGVFRLEYDGACKGNPGKAGGGALIRNPDGSPFLAVKVGAGRATSNVAEYKGLIEGLRAAQKKGIQKLHVQGDSTLVCKQVQGLWAVNKPHLMVLCEEAKELAGGFEEFNITQVERSLNSAADELANQAVFLSADQVALVEASDLPHLAGHSFGSHVEATAPQRKRLRLKQTRDGGKKERVGR